MEIPYAVSMEDRRLGLQLSKADLKPLTIMAGKYGYIFQQYSHNYDEVINQGLRNNQVSPFIQRKVKQMMDAIDEVPPIDRDYVLYRGTMGREYTVGQSYIDPGFQSKTISFTRRFLEEGCCLLRIQYPPGTRQMPIYTVSRYPHEDEILTYPNEEIYIEQEEISDGIEVYTARFVRYVPFTLTTNISDFPEPIIDILYPGASDGLIMTSDGTHLYTYIINPNVLNTLERARKSCFPWEVRIDRAEVYDKLYFLLYKGTTSILVLNKDLLELGNKIQFRNGAEVKGYPNFYYLIFELYMDPSQFLTYNRSKPVFFIYDSTTRKVQSSIEYDPNQQLFGMENRELFDVADMFPNGYPFVGRPAVDLEWLTRENMVKNETKIYNKIRVTIQLAPLEDGNDLGNGIILQHFARISDPIAIKQRLPDPDLASREYSGYKEIEPMDTYRILAVVYSLNKNELIREYIPGRILSNESLSPMEFLRLFILLCLGLDQFPSYRYQNLSPKNIMVKKIEPRDYPTKYGIFTTDLVPKLPDQPIFQPKDEYTPLADIRKFLQDTGASFLIRPILDTSGSISDYLDTLMVSSEIQSLFH